MLKKIKSLKYPNARDVYKHPETKEEFEELLAWMIKANEIDDCTGVFTIAMQLIPRVVEMEDGSKSLKEVLTEWIDGLDDHEEISVIDVIEIIDRVYPGFLVECNKRRMQQ